MISLMTLVKMARKWRNSTAISRKRISFPSNSEDVEADTNGTTLIADKGHFVVYSEDKRRFVIPLVYLNIEVIRQLLKMSEEEFGLPGNSPCDAFLTEYIITLIRRGVAQDLEKAMIMTISEKRCTSSSLHQGQTNQQILFADNGASLLLMVSLMTLIKMAKMWLNLAAINRKRISLPSKNEDVEVHSIGTTVADKGHFVVYSDDGSRFVIPLVYLNNEVLRQLLKMSEEEFGLPGDGPITLPCDAFLMEYIITLIRRGVAQDLENALLLSVHKNRCALSPSLHQGQINQQLLYSVYGEMTKMISLITLVKMARKWRKLTVIRRKRISLPKNKEDVEVNRNGTPFVADKGHFVVYSDDGRRVVIPLPYLNNKVVRQLLIMAEGEFGLPCHGHTMPCDAFMVEYIISMIR
ncbi:hypothetical protein RJ639_005323 [Escallonia herrerae]|uniref:Small auxin up regulated protein n=1 Tax=Escallonia herrerae TaxID=1293975 RepID=A0AA88VUD1_9ASTE|nr:hypothetical protein RJ639_005323 [Escallonia herrerae]